MSRSNTVASLIAVLGSLFATEITFAADMPMRPYRATAAPLPSWSGCYLGGNFGAGWDTTHSGGIAFAGVPNPLVDYGASTGNSLIGGGQVGCDYQFGSQWVVGIQGKAEFENINSTNLVVAFPGITASYRLKNTDTLTGRIGYAFTPDLLAYAKGGAAWARANASALAAAFVGETASFSATGYTVGGGVEFMFAPCWSVFGEFNYMDFGTRNVNLFSTGQVNPGFGPAGALADTIAMRLRNQEIVVGVNYRFN